MQNGRAFFSVAFAASALVMVAVACGDDSESKFEGDGEPDATFDTGPGFVVDANSDDGSAPPSCNPVVPAVPPVWKAPTKTTGACTEQELGEYYDACLGPKDPDAGDTCKTWTDAHTACRDCVEPTDDSGPIQWHRDRYYYTLNVAGCLALERGEPEDGKCPSAYNASMQCQRDSCDGCFASSSATFADFQKCQESAKGTTCSSYATKLGESCGSTYNDPDGGAYDCFRQGGEGAKPHFVRVEGIFCGP